MAHEVGQEDARAEALLALARYHAGYSIDARAEVERLDGAHDDFKGEAALAVARLWQALDEPARAIAAAQRAHAKAVADGEPYVFRHTLNLTRALLEELGTELPEVPKCDPAKAPTFDWEPDVRKLIEELKAKRAEDDDAA